MKLHIAYGSQTGNAKNLAHTIGGQFEDLGIEVEVLDMGESDPEEIHQMSHLLIVTSTYGDGEAPDNASEWLSYLKFSDDDIKFPNLSYAVLGLGDRYYPHFCQCARDFDELLSKASAKPLISRLECDLYYEEQYPEWVQGLIQVFNS